MSDSNHLNHQNHHHVPQTSPAGGEEHSVVKERDTSPFPTILEEGKEKGSVAALPDQPISNVEEELLIEQDGDFFWVFQRVTWGIVKTAVVLGGIIFLAWLIWHPGKQHSDESEAVHPEHEESSVDESQKERKIFVKKEEPKVVEKQAVTAVDSDQKEALLAVRWAEWIEMRRQMEQKDTLSQSLSWIKRAATFSEIPPLELVQGENSAVRAQRIDAALGELHSLIESANMLQTQLLAEIEEHGAQLNEARALEDASKDALDSQLQMLDGAGSGSALSQRITAQQNIAQHSSEIEVRKTVFNHIERYESGLQTFLEALQANREALIQDIRVVQFPNDFFERVMTPAEWRSNQ